MTPTTRRTIQLKGLAPYRELVAAVATIKPGHLIEKDTSGELILHATEGGTSSRLFAIEDSLQGKSVDDTYAIDDQVRHIAAVPGDEVYAFLKAGQSVAIDDDLISNGDGTLIKLSGASSGVTVNQVMAKANEANVLTASGAVDTRMSITLL